MKLPVARWMMLAMLAPIALSNCSSWTGPAVTPHHQAASSDDGLRLRLDPVWQQSVNEQGIAGFKPIEPYGVTVGRNGTVAVAAFSGIIHGLEGTSGHEQWQLDLGNVPSTSITAAGDRFYVGVSDGRVLALDERTGEEVWSSKLSHIVHGQPTVHQGRVYVLTTEEAVVALDERNGDVLWTYRHPRVAELEIQGGSRPTIIDGDVYVGFSDGTFYRLNTDGQLVWFADLSHGHRRMIDVDTAAVGYENLVIAASHSGGLSAVHKETGTVQWTVDRNGFRDPVIIDDLLIASASGGRVYWIDPLTGRIQQEMEMLRGGLTAPLHFTNHTFVIGDRDRGALVVDVHQAKIHALFEATVGISGAMDFQNDMLFAVTNRGMVYGLQVRAY